MGTLQEELAKLPNKPGTFYIDDKVTWKETKSNRAKELIRSHSVGPFTVIEVIPLNNKFEQKGAEHHQLVIVTKEDGALFFPGETERNKFSGAWFRKIPF